MNTELRIRPIEMTDNLSLYKKWVESLANEKSPSPIFNGGEEYAAILMSEIFKATTEELCIYSNALNPQLTSIDIYYNALKTLLENKNIKLKVALQSRPIDNSAAYKLIKENAENNTNVKIKIITTQENEIIRAALKNTNVHFAVADGKIFRMEHDPQNYKAIASFNNPEIAQTLKKAFDLLDF